jgi:hypothetical protein
MTKLWTLLVAMAVMLTAFEASAATVKFCLRTPGFYDDNDYGEDNWPADAYRLPRGALAVVTKTGGGGWSGYLGDGIGAGDPGAACTSDITVSNANGEYSLTVSGDGDVNSNDIFVRDEYGVYVDASTTYNVTGGSGTYEVTFSNTFGAWNVLNTYNAAAYSLARHVGGMSDQEYWYWVGPWSGSSFSEDYDRTAIAYVNVEEKYVISHETGHAILSHRTGGRGDNGYTLETDSPSPCDSTEFNHRMYSKEHQITAFVEGFADFYAADVWNDHDQTDCQYQVGSAGYDCEDGTGTSFSNGWLESQCATTHDNRGVELDWMRVFWAVHTMGAAPDPGFSEIVDWINDATLETGWGSVEYSNAFFKTACRASSG